MHKLFIHNVDDCIQHIQDNEKADNITFITNTDLTHILFQMVDDTYMPYTQFDYGILSRLSFKLKNKEVDEKAIIYTIEYTDSSMVENEIMPIEPSDITNYDKADRHIYEWLLNKNNISQRNDYSRSIKKTYPIAPLGGYFEGCGMNCEYNTVDFNKAYTYNAKDMQYFPVLNNFDVYINI